MTAAMVKWLSPEMMHALGWALLHFLWQGTAIAALAAGAIALCRRASARYALGVGALVVMLLAPVATFLSYSRQGSGRAEAVKLLSPAAAFNPAAGRTAAHGPAGFTSAAPAPDMLPWLVEAWLCGVALFSLRTAGGFLLLSRQRRGQLIPVSSRVLDICSTLETRLGLHRAIAYCECKWMQVPAVIGWFRPIVFLPASALTGLSEEQLQSVIAHELAHNVFQIWVETLLFYHPAVWWLNQKIRAEREHCCDDVAVAVCGDAVEYARALTLMEEWRSLPALALAVTGGSLTDRIVRLLGLKTASSRRRGVGLTASVLCLTAALIAGSGLFGLARPNVQAALAQTSQTPSASSSPASSSTPSARSTKSAPAAKPSPAHPQTAEPASGSHPASGSYIDEMKAAGLSDLTANELIAMKVQDITPEYVRGLREQGVNPAVEKLIAMKVQDITPEYIRDLHAAGLNPDEDHLIALKVQGVDAAYFHELKSAGLQPDVDRLIALKVQDVTPEYVRELQAAGIKANTDQIIGLKIQDVSPAYLKGLHDQGLNPDANEAIGMRIQGVTPEYVRDMKALGLNPTTHELIAMRVQEVTPEYVKALQAAGFNPSVNEIIGAKIQDLTPEFIERARQHGFKDLTLQKLIQLRHLGILDSKADL